MVDEHGGYKCTSTCANDDYSFRGGGGLSENRTGPGAFFTPKSTPSSQHTVTAHRHSTPPQHTVTAYRQRHRTSSLSISPKAQLGTSPEISGRVPVERCMAGRTPWLSAAVAQMMGACLSEA